MREVRPESLRIAMIVAFLLTAGPDVSAAGGEPLRYDCGTLAIYTLLGIEGHKLRLGELEQRMPDQPTSGYSMQQLRDTARAYGLPLEGVLWKDKEHPPDRPFLAFIKHPGHGHYIVIRPVGLTRKMVQVLDNIYEVGTYDFSEVAASPEWTGLILREAQSNWAGSYGVILSIIVPSFLAGLYVLFRRVRRRFA